MNGVVVLELFIGDIVLDHGGVILCLEAVVRVMTHPCSKGNQDKSAMENWVHLHSCMFITRPYHWNLVYIRDRRWTMPMTIDGSVMTRRMRLLELEVSARTLFLYLFSLYDL